MSALALFVKSPWLFLLAVVVFGFVPIVVTALAARMYPAADARRREIAGEVSAIKVWQRPMWAAEQLARGICEGLPARRLARKEAKTRRVLDRRYYDEQRRAAELRELEQAEFEQLLVEARLLDAVSVQAHVHATRRTSARTRHHGAPAASRRRAALVPAVLMLTIGAALGLLAVLSPGAPAATSPPSRGFQWTMWGVSVAVAVALIVMWMLAFVSREALSRKADEQHTRAERYRSVRAAAMGQRL